MNKSILKVNRVIAYLQDYKRKDYLFLKTHKSIVPFQYKLYMNRLYINKFKGIITKKYVEKLLPIKLYTGACICNHK